MISKHLKPQSCLRALCGFFVAGLSLFAAGRTFIPWESAKPILEAQRGHVPVELRDADAARWSAWERREDQAVRTRLRQGDLDSMVNLLLLGSSFTKQPRIRMENLAEASRSGALRARVDDLVAGMRDPRDNERLIFVQGLLRNQGVDFETADAATEAGKFVYENLLRVARERRDLAERAAQAGGGSRTDEPASLLDRSSLFEKRGLSLDTGILPDFSIEQTLRDLKAHDHLREGQVRRVAVIGPGLDFIDKNEDSAWDYYPQQTLQPFALYDSLVRLKLAKAGALSVSVFDISSRVIEHLRRAREKANKNAGYTVQLPRDAARPWPPDLIAYWNSLGDQVGDSVAAIAPPRIFEGLQTRAVRIRPDVVLACAPVDLDIVFERDDLAEADRFDLIVATNIFLYYDRFRQALALENVGAMLKPRGFLLTNDRLPTAPEGSMSLRGVTVVPFGSAREAVGWYQKQ